MTNLTTDIAQRIVRLFAGNDDGVRSSRVGNTLVIKVQETPAITAQLIGKAGSHFKALTYILNAIAESSLDNVRFVVDDPLESTKPRPVVDDIEEQIADIVDDICDVVFEHPVSIHISEDARLKATDIEIVTSPGEDSEFLRKIGKSMSILFGGAGKAAGKLVIVTVR